MQTSINALYITVKEMSRAIRFYEKVFGVSVTKRDKQMSSFIFDHFSFLLFHPAIEGETVNIDNNIVPNIEVEDVEVIKQFVEHEGCSIVLPITVTNEYKLFQAYDTEGNIIEFYEVLKKK